jgi:hypothetical protein
VKPALMVLGIVLGAAALFVASAWYYHYRRFRSCVVELEAAVHSAKTYEAFLQDPRPDGLYRRLEGHEPGALRQLVSAWSDGPEQSADWDVKASRAQASAVFRFGDMVYLLFFDDRNRLQEFVCVGN